MVASQIINKILHTGDISLLESNGLTVDYFIGYEQEYQFLINHYEQYGNVPDKATFLAAFVEFDILDVGESDRYLIDTIREEYLYYQTVPIIQKSAELLKGNANEAVDFLLTSIEELTPSYSIGGVDIIKSAAERLELFKSKLNGDDPWYITTGFPELDDILHGWSKSEEFVVFLARTGQGKSWVLTKTLGHAWGLGLRAGLISPEMSPVKVGYRFDTLTNNFSNSGLLWANASRIGGLDEYERYIADLTQKEGFIVATPRDFQKKITIAKLKAFIQSNRLDILGIDGITYLSDERYKRGDNKTTSLTNISEDLISLSAELGVPILTVVQVNRGGVKGQDDEGTPELEYIRDSDGIAYNATKVIALRQVGGGLEFGIKKHRDGKDGGKLNYFWDIDKGEFKYIPASDDAAKPQVREQKVKETRNSFKDGKVVF